MRFAFFLCGGFFPAKSHGTLHETHSNFHFTLKHGLFFDTFVVVFFHRLSTRNGPNGFSILVNWVNNEFSALFTSHHIALKHKNTKRLSCLLKKQWVFVNILGMESNRFSCILTVAIILDRSRGQATTRHSKVPGGTGERTWNRTWRSCSTNQHTSRTNQGTRTWKRKRSSHLLGGMFFRD